MSAMAKAVLHSPIHTSVSWPFSLPPPHFLRPSTLPANQSKIGRDRTLILHRCSFITAAASGSSSASAVTPSSGSAPPVIKKRLRYRRQYPGENVGITEEMRFVAMRLRNINGKNYTRNSDSDDDDGKQKSTLSEDEESGASESESDGDEMGGTWKPSMEGFLKYLVDSQLVFSIVERIVDESEDVAYSYFRKTGLERSEAILKDLEWLRQKGMVIPEPTNVGVSYGKYLEELAEKSAPMFLCHFYNIYFSHIAGGQVIAKQVSENLLEGVELEFYRWEGEVPELLKGVREKLNTLGEHWSRDVKNKCLREASKSFKLLGQLVRLIIL
ncbi:probable inactive heme oxygenase 2, chloroplastic [Humulus lupulus]|uniref:probable inactive heme oxygenase 2, chloroplastic n=1 Tax=Humulus lupulus TaxID=3486 RepID=UPI002B41372B|nr:probable inactive heme oxygenase 2, chloroplastic [Humulus lupulus]